jgi:FMN phosphatase YigB (HAD superfamily)
MGVRDKHLQGPNRCGIQAVWFRPGQEPLDGTGSTHKAGAGWRTIADLAELPGVLEALRLLRTTGRRESR